MNAAIDALLARLYHPGLARIDLSLDRVRRFLALLDDPQKRLPPVIHVAGTNGKGSLAAYLQAIFEKAGYTPHRYISPHLVSFNERIVLNGKPIDDDYLEALLERVSACVERQPVTFFEATTAAAFLAFSEYPADVLLLETGLGGRLDATNVIERPALTAITPVSFDHCDFLGDTLEAIAAEKAGILKHGVPCVAGRQERAADDVIAQTAEVKAAPLYRFGREWQVQRRSGQAVYQSPERALVLQPPLVGAHQYDNAATAVACIDRLPQFNISEHAIKTGLANTVWPGRLQRLTLGGYVRLLPKGVELWLDGGHNPQGGEILAAWLKERGVREVYLVCGMVQGKNTEGYLKPLAPFVTALYAVAIPEEALSQPAAQVEAAARAAGIEAYPMLSIENALQIIAFRAKTPAIICICGSLYLAGRVLATN